MVFDNTNIGALKIAKDVVLATINPISKDPSVNMTDLALTHCQSTYLLIAGIEALRTLEHCDIPRVVGSEHGEAPTLHVNGTDLTMAQVVVSTDSIPEQVALARAVVELAQSGLRIILDLCTASKFSNLDDHHIDSYMASKKVIGIVPTAFVRIIPMIRGYIPDFADRGDVDQYITQNNWMRYRMSFSSTASLIVRATEYVNDICPNMFSANERAIVKGSLDSPHSAEANRLIHQITIAKAYHILKAMDDLPKGWIQGDKSLSQVNAVTLNKIIRGVTHWKNIQNSDMHNEVIDNVQDLALYTVASGFTPNADANNVIRAKRDLAPVMPGTKATRAVVHRSFYEENKLGCQIGAGFLLWMLSLAFMAILIKLITG